MTLETANTCAWQTRVSFLRAAIIDANTNAAAGMAPAPVLVLGIANKSPRLPCSNDQLRATSERTKALVAGTASRRQ